MKRSLAFADLGDANRDLAWADAVAKCADILKRSPYATPELLPEIESAIEARAGRDAERDEFIELFARARSLLEWR